MVYFVRSETLALQPLFLLVSIFFYPCVGKLKLLVCSSFFPLGCLHVNIV